MKLYGFWATGLWTATVATAGQQAATPVITPEKAIAALERSLDTELRRADQPAPPGLAARMQEVPVRGLSIAVIHQGRLHWARGFGEAREGVPVTPDTRFQAGSISKAVAALGVLALAESRGVKVDDDLRPMLKRWQPPREAAEPITPRYTLRRLLSHSAGLGQGGFPGYKRGAAMPALPDILDGLLPSNTGPVRPVQAPGVDFRYSGGGSTVVQLWVEDVTGQPFPTQMQKWVLQPMQLLHSQFGPPEVADDPRFAMSHQGFTPEPGGPRVYPEMQAAGLWSTPSDIAAAWIAVQRALAGQSSPVSLATAQAVTTAVTPLTSIGFFLDGNGGAARRFGHNGSNQGFESFSTAYVSKGEGVVIMANGQNTWGLVDAVVRTLGRVYQWPGLAAPVALAAQTLPAEAMQWVGTYPRQEGPALQVRLHEGWLYLASGPGGWQRLWRTETGAYSTERGRPLLRFSADGLAAADDTHPSPRQALLTVPWPPVFFRGSVNNWRAERTLQQVTDGQWRALVELPAGRHEFKLGDADWQTFNLGSSGGSGEVGLNTWTPLSARGGNLVVNIPDDGTYLLELEASDSPSPPRLRLSPVKPTETKS